MIGTKNKNLSGNKKVSKNRPMAKIIRVFLLRRNKNRVPYEIQSDREPSGCAFIWVMPLITLHTTHRQQTVYMWIYKNTFYGNISLRQVPNATTPPLFSIIFHLSRGQGSAADACPCKSPRLSSLSTLLTASAVGQKTCCPKIFTKISLILNSRQFYCPNFFRPFTLCRKKFKTAKRIQFLEISTKWDEA